MSREAGRRQWLVGLLLALSAGGLPAVAADQPGEDCSAAQPWPARFTLSFAVTAARGPLSLDGENELHFTTEGQRYELRSQTRSALYKAQQRSRGVLAQRWLRPQEYVEQNRRGPSTTQINYELRNVSFSANVDAPAPVVPRLQDRLTMLLQLGAQLQQEQQGKQGQAGAPAAIEFPVAGVRHVSPYRFELMGGEQLQLPAGTFDTRRLRRQGDDGDAIDVWLAPQLCWLPVRLRFADEHGLTVESRLRKASFD